MEKQPLLNKIGRMCEQIAVLIEGFIMAKFIGQTQWSAISGQFARS